jgi:hypothetical protein
VSNKTKSVQIWVHWVNVIITFWLSSSLPVMWIYDKWERNYFDAHNVCKYQVKYFRITWM